MPPGVWAKSAGFVLYRVGHAAPSVRFEFKSGFVRAERHRLFYEELGTDERGSVLCLHGGPGGTHHLMRPVADLAQFGYRVVLYDQSGCGLSQRPRSYRGMTIEGLADEAEAVRRALDLGRCHLLGTSFGGALVLQTALRHPRGFRSLIIGSGYASVDQLSDEKIRLVARLPRAHRDAIEACEYRGRPRERRYQRALAEFRRLHVSELSVTPIELVLSSRNFNPEVWRALVGGSDLTVRATGTMARWDVRDQLHRIRLPTLITVGRRDFITPSCARAVHRGIRGSRLIVFERGGHDYLYSERDKFVASVREFLDRVR